jgi:hypothetical protein
MSGVGHTRWLRILFGLSISKCEMDHISLLVLCPEVAPRRDEGVIGHDPKSGGDRMSHLGQNAKYPLRADVFCFASSNGHSAIGSAGPFGADCVEKLSC